MSFAQQSVLPLSFSVERLLQHSASANHTGSRKPGSLGSSSDIESTPPSSPASSCNSIDSKEMQSTTPTFGGRVLLNAPGFTTLPCIPLSAFTWHPSAAALHPSPHQTTPMSYRVSGVGAAVGTPHLTATYPSVNLPLQRQHLQGRLVTEKLVKTARTAELRETKPVRSKASSSNRLQPTPSKLLLSAEREQLSEISPYNRATAEAKSNEIYHQDSDHDSASFKKKRTTFTSSQLESLEIRFSQQKYLTKHDRTKLALSLGLTEKHIKTWYQNRRTKWKRECSDEVWSKERETAAAAMYAQHMQLKSSSVDETCSEDNNETSVLS